MKLKIIAALLVLSGCSSSQTTQYDSEKGVAPVLAQELGMEEANFRFFTIAFLMEANANENSRATRGIVALTNNDLYFIEGNYRNIKSGTDIRIPIARIEGMDILKKQIQLKTGEERTIVWITDSKRVHNVQGFKRFSALLVSDEVLPWQSDTRYTLPGFSTKPQSPLDRSLAPGVGTPGSTAGAGRRPRIGP